MILNKWNYKKHIYEDYEIPNEWNCQIGLIDMNEIVNCTHCGKELPFGNTYTSLEIHTEMGFGYGVCEECHKGEMKRKYGR